MDRELVGMLAIMAATLVVGLAGILAGRNWLGEVSCKGRWSADFQPTYGLLEGCMIVVDGKRIPSANYRVL